MNRRIIFCALAILFFLATPGISAAQSNALKISMMRPGEGEIIYTGQGAPYVTVPVTGYITGASAPAQVKLELFQNARPEGSLTTTPDKDGKYWFDVAINANNPDDHPVAECADGQCHILSRLGFPPGRVLIRVTVIDSAGRQARVERNVIVDQSGSANVPVQAVTANGESIPAGLTLTAQTRIYDWRLRQYIASTDANGRAVFNIERLAEAHTQYIFKLDPVVVDGVQYFSRAPAQLTLAPNTAINAPVKLWIETRRGQINATLTATTPLTVRAIELPTGRAHTAQSTNGTVALNDLPIGKYLLTVDAEQAAKQSLMFAPRKIDLSEQPITSTVLNLTPASSRVVRGTVRDETGASLPFAWLQIDGRDIVQRVAPDAGSFVLPALPGDARAARVFAPGFFSQAAALDADDLNIALTRQPNAKNLPWGSGSITLPPQTSAKVSEAVDVWRGWVWGQGTGKLSLATATANIEVNDGAFALEVLPDAPSWLYVRAGYATLKSFTVEQAITVDAGQMIAFGADVAMPAPVPFDTAVVRALHANEPVPVPIENETAPLARARDALARWGISPMRWLICIALGAVVLAGWFVKKRARRLAQ